MNRASTAGDKGIISKLGARQGHSAVPGGVLAIPR
jgi:hypothetical protein